MKGYAMTRFFKPLMAALVLATSVLATGPARAQDTGAAPNSLTVTFQDWVVRCAMVTVQDGSQHQACEMAQELTQSDTGQRVLSAIVRKTRDDTGLTVIAPFGLLLSQGVAMSIDGSDPVPIAFRTCLPGGCIAPKVLSDAELASLARGNEAVLTMANTNDQPFTVTLSLAGFSAALKRLGQECCGG